MQAELGDIVYVELPEVGSEVKKGEQFGVIESVKVRCFFGPSTPNICQGCLSPVLSNLQTCAGRV